MVTHGLYQTVGSSIQYRLLSVTETIHIRYCMEECPRTVNRISFGLEENPPSYHLRCPVLAGMCLILSATLTTVPCTGRSGTFISNVNTRGGGRSLSTPLPSGSPGRRVRGFCGTETGSEEGLDNIQPSLLLLRQQAVRAQLADSTIILCLPARILCSVNVESSLAHQIIMREISANA